jgi:hypothetical protein
LGASIGARRLARRVLDLHPALERGAQLIHVHGLGQIGVHAGREAALVLALHGVGGDGDDRRARRRAAALALEDADLARQLVTVHARHVDVGEHRRIRPFCRGPGLDPPRCRH